MANRFCSDKEHWPTCHITAWDNRISFLPSHVHFLEESTRPELNALHISMLLHFPAEMRIAPREEFTPILPKQALSEMLSLNADWLSSQGFTLLDFERVPKYSTITMVMNYAMVPCGIVVILVCVVLAKCSANLTKEHEFYWALRAQRKQLEAKQRRLQMFRQRLSIFPSSESLSSRYSSTSSEPEPSQPPPKVTISPPHPPGVSHGRPTEPQIFTVTPLPSALKPYAHRHHRDHVSVQIDPSISSSDDRSDRSRLSVPHQRRSISVSSGGFGGPVVVGRQDHGFMSSLLRSFTWSNRRRGAPQSTVKTKHRPMVRTKMIGMMSGVRQGQGTSGAGGQRHYKMGII